MLDSLWIVSTHVWYDTTSHTALSEQKAVFVTVDEPKYTRNTSLFRDTDYFRI